MSVGICGNCQWRDGDECHIRAPKQTVGEAYHRGERVESGTAIWPIIKKEDSCGEWVVHPEWAKGQHF